jgi:hypothetical protein
VEFKTIDGYPYEIYEDGTLFRMERKGRTGRCLHRIQIRPYKQTNGYLEVRLFNTKENKYKKLYLHRVMYMAFKGDIGDLEVEHIDCNPGNCVLTNLRAVSHKDNCNNPRTLERYRTSNSLDKGKFNRERMLEAQSQEHYQKLVDTYQELKKVHGYVGIWMLMQEGHCGYPRAKKIIAEMEGKNDANQ